ncbi:GntR family transcriptional regulator [Anaerocolumna xylanovorans]|uniref:DNA-binding transcriptional regulator, GntR family n=1 Tax=Anaerocolumna xylanovorans DSM 12503 TaxID=1121345 RepID=A0A1M7YEV5_9FIRM|nr:GntR family transcriptional regulator [Anaerocolumna xylanovorans]SHO51160.1 DNA-binding transcriptional regulator, GntR family [Anaerocolumna xylanovorans DSM 12503]
MEILERYTKETAREYALRVIRHNIISLELVPGSLVSENELAKELGTSRTPVREALIELSKINLVEIYPQKGSYISLINHDLVEEARFVRLLLEAAIAEEACDRAEEKDIKALEENIRLQEVYQGNDWENKLLELDNEFHEILFKICKKQFTYNLLTGMMTHFDRVRRLSLTVVKDSKILKDHKSLVEAIKLRDKQTAREVITKHLSRYELDEETLRKNYGEYYKS